MKKEFFGKTNSQQDVYRYTISNDFLSVSIINFGGTIQELLCPDSNNIKENIVLGYDNIESYEIHSPYFGAVTGRNAGRIAYGQFSLQEKIYHLAVNNGEHHLHGGITGLDKQIWKEEFFSNDTLILSYDSPDLEEGYPGNVHFKLTYILEKQSLHWTIEATTDKDTPINITNHTYFNLSSNKDLAVNHFLKIDSDSILTIDHSSLPNGTQLNVENTPFDFRKSKRISQDIDSNHTQINFGSGYDHPFMLSEKSIPIELYDESSHRCLEVETNQPTCVFYTGNFLSEELGVLNSNQVCKRRLGICLETQMPPNAVNIEQYHENTIITPQKPYFQKTSWHFSIK